MIDCPMCSGEGGGEVDDCDARGEHRSRYVTCPNCGGSGQIARACSACGSTARFKRERAARRADELGEP